MAITHIFRSSGRTTEGHCYFAFIEDGQLVIGDSLYFMDTISYRGTYEGATYWLRILKEKDLKLYNRIEEYFANYVFALKSDKTIKVAGLKPGDRFKRKGTEYLMLDFKPSEYFISASLSSCFMCAVNLSTYKVVCLDKTWEVELIK